MVIAVDYICSLLVLIPLALFNLYTFPWLCILQLCFIFATCKLLKLQCKPDNFLLRKTLTCNSVLLYSTYCICILALLKIQCTPGNLLHRKTLTCSNFVLFAICTLLKIHSGSGNISAKLMSYTKILWPGVSFVTKIEGLKSVDTVPLTTWLGLFDNPGLGLVASTCNVTPWL